MLDTSLVALTRNEADMQQLVSVSKDGKTVYQYCLEPYTSYSVGFSGSQVNKHFRLREYIDDKDADKNSSRTGLPIYRADKGKITSVVGFPSSTKNYLALAATVEYDIGDIIVGGIDWRTIHAC